MNLSAFVLVSLTMCLYTERAITAAPNKLLSHEGDFIESNLFWKIQHLEGHQ